MSRKTKLALALGLSFVFTVLIARAVAPVYILGYVNRTLEGLEGYSGRVKDIDLHIWRGAYEIEGVNIVKTGEEAPIPFVSVDRVDISVHWDALLNGAIVGEIDLHAPKVNYVAEKKETKQEQQQDEREAEQAASGDSSWQKQIKELVPLAINRIGIHGGEIHYLDSNSAPKVDVYVKKFSGQLTNLTNSTEISESLVATADFRGVALNSGKLTLKGRVDPYKETPTFQLAAQLEDLQMTELNDFLKAYVNVDAERGRISVYTEVGAANGRFKGYVKPLIRDLRLLRWKEEEERPIMKLWEGLVEAGTELFEHDDKQQVATKMPFSGKLESPSADLGTTVIYVLRNAWIQALQRGLEGGLGEGLARRGGKDE